MKATVITVLGLCVALATALILMPTSGSAQGRVVCKQFNALAQATLPTTRRLALTDKWGGPLYAKLGNDFLPDGILSGNDGTQVINGNVAYGIDGVYVIGFGCTAPVSPSTLWTCTDTLRVEVPLSVYGFPPPLYSTYNGDTARAAGGTGHFQTASGNLKFSGPYMVWEVTGTPPRNGRFNAELSGEICGLR